ncbi:hypothetical protein [Vibrio crassostreae]|uniref:hypothetical protein n=1 Tax=Vibrio crassostreae TaxID=246167 RepID=UPI001B304F1C|nr:hypothetical protein [Vibrio crassostreae]
MNISKTTENFAKKRGLEIEVSEPLGDIPNPIVWIWEEGEDSEPMFSYLINEDESLSFRGNVYLDQSIKEELPAHIRDEKHLREVLDFVAKELKAPTVEMDFAAKIQAATETTKSDDTPKQKATVRAGMKL